MVEKITFMQAEDGMATFEKSDGTTIIYPLNNVPKCYKEGDIIKAIIFRRSFIFFLKLDTDEMKRRQARLLPLKERLRRRARRGTNNL